MKPWEELLLYWRSKHILGRPPRRQDIDPILDIPHLVSNLLLVDVLPEGYRYRLVGSAIVDLHMEELTGRMAGSSQFASRVRRETLRAYDIVRTEQRPRILHGMLNAFDPPSVVATVLPLLALNGETDMLLAGVFTDKEKEPVGQINYLVILESPS